MRYGAVATFVTLGALAPAPAISQDVGRIAQPSVSAGTHHTCAVTITGATYCWGRNYLGWDDVARSPDLVEVASSRPVAVWDHLTVRSVSSGEGHSCVLTTAGAAYCWGMNLFGQLGDGSKSDSQVPVAVSGGLVFGSISVGQLRTCGVTVDGAAYCWGANSQGSLGDGSNNDSNVPVPVSGDLTFGSVSAGWSQTTCGVATDGAAYCWGSNTIGLLGNGSRDIRSAVPVEVSGGLVLSSVSVGSAQNCGITRAGAAYCWGLAPRGTRVPLKVPGGIEFQSVSVGARHVCGVSSRGAAYCWGMLAGFLVESEWGETAEEPIQIAGDLTFRSVSSNGRGQHNCGTTTAETIYCWGRNANGQLGDGTEVHSSEPVFVDLRGGR